MTVIIAVRVMSAAAVSVTSYPHVRDSAGIIAQDVRPAHNWAVRGFRSATSEVASGLSLAPSGGDGMNSDRSRSVHHMSMDACRQGCSYRRTRQQGEGYQILSTHSDF